MTAESDSLGLLRDPATNKEFVIVGSKGHEVAVKHKPRVPVLDVPGRVGDVVQFLGRKSRVFLVRRGIVDGEATSPLKVNPLLVGGITETPTETVSFATERVAETMGEATSFGAQSVNESLSELVELVVTP